MTLPRDPAPRCARCRSILVNFECPSVACEAEFIANEPPTEDLARMAMKATPIIEAACRQPAPLPCDPAPRRPHACQSCGGTGEYETDDPIRAERDDLLSTVAAQRTRLRAASEAFDELASFLDYALPGDKHVAMLRVALGSMRGLPAGGGK